MKGVSRSRVACIRSRPAERAYYRTNQMLGPWLIDFLTDPRVLHNVPAALRRAEIARADLGAVSISDVQASRPSLTLSFDIERDVDQPFESVTSRTARPFLEQVRLALQPTALRATFFVQGAMVAELAEPLGALVADGHEVGLHGFAHEMWGKSNWIARQHAITPAERARRLDAALLAFERCGLPQPAAFRAPNFTIDRATYRLLSERGFLVDSSPPSQRGNINRPHWRAGLRVIPVSCAPLPELHRHPLLRVVTAVHYQQLNFDVYLGRPFSHVAQLCADTLRHAQASNSAPYLLMYAHNWEFQREYGDAIARLVSRSNALLERFCLTPATLSETASALLPYGGSGA